MSQSPPLVTVLMSVYNAKNTLDNAIKSILNQTYEKFEFLIIDDGSDDDTWERLVNYAAVDERIKLVRNEENKGLGYCLWQGVAIAKGTFIARMDADDIARPARLERQVRVMTSDASVHILGTWAEDIDDDGRVIGYRKVPVTHAAIRKTMPFANPMLHSSVMFRREAILSVGSYNPNCRWLQDYDLWFRCMAAGLGFQNIPEFLMQYRVGRSYHRRKSWQYRKVDFQVRLQGYRTLGVRGLEWSGLAVPLILGAVPSSLAPLVHRIGKKFDPRQKVT